MAKWLKKKLPKYGDNQREDLRKAVIALSAQAQLPYQRAEEAKDRKIIEEGRSLISDDIGCTDCHQFLLEDEEAIAPDLTGYGSRDWIIAIISDPSHDRFYGKKNDDMPAFGRDEKLTLREIEIIADWLRRDWYEAGSEEE